jgi:hypothetical protein
VLWRYASGNINDVESDSMKKGTRKTSYDKYKNFEEVAKKLLAVPKEELDKQRAAYQVNKDKSTKPTG